MMAVARVFTDPSVIRASHGYFSLFNNSDREGKKGSEITPII